MLGLLPAYPESPHVNTSWAQTPVLWETIAPLFCHLSSSLPSTAPLGAACIPQAQSMLLSAKQSLPKPTANALSPQISQRLLKNLDFFFPIVKRQSKWGLWSITKCSRFRAGETDSREGSPPGRFPHQPVPGDAVGIFNSTFAHLSC